MRDEGKSPGLDPGAGQKTEGHAARRRFAGVLCAALAVALVCLFVTMPPLWQGDYPRAGGLPYFSGTEDRVGLNTAPAAELALLPGIGEKRALAIVAYREENGPFSCVGELARVKGISERIVDGLQAYACLS